MSELRYRNPASFRQALSDRLRVLAETSKWSLEQLQRHVAYDRLLERVYLSDDGWVVKGATALLARDLSARGSLDVDLFRDAASEQAQGHLRRAVRNDIGDWFRFELGATRSMDAVSTARIPVVAHIGATEWCRFHVDLSGDELRMTGEPEHVPPLAPLALSGLAQHGYRAYPLVDHIADKIPATVQRYGTMRLPSTRYKDLVDLVSISAAASVSASAQAVALTSEAERRGVTLPCQFTLPDRQLWERGYSAEAARSLLPITARTVDEALAAVRPFVEPVFDRRAVGVWDPRRRAWRLEDRVGSP